jgi:hypothetical protein
MLKLQADSAFINASIVTLWNKATVFTVYAKKAAADIGVVHEESTEIGQVDLVVEADGITREAAAQAVTDYTDMIVTHVEGVAVKTYRAEEVVVD